MGLVRNAINSQLWEISESELEAQLLYTGCKDESELRRYYAKHGYVVVVRREKADKSVEDKPSQATKQDVSPKKVKGSQKGRHASEIMDGVLEAYEIIYNNEEQHTQYDMPKYNGTARLTLRHRGENGEYVWSDKVTKRVITGAPHYFAEVFRFLDGFDYYISANTFFHDKATGKDVVSCLNNIVIDVDCHKEGYSQEELRSLIGEYIKAVDTYLTQNGLQYYNIAHETPRGVHFWYHLVQDSIKMSALYRDVVGYIAEVYERIRSSDVRFADLDVDITASKRADGWFRAFGAGTVVHISHDVAFDLHDLARVYREHCHPAPKQTVQSGVRPSEQVTDKHFDKKDIKCINTRLKSTMKHRLNLIEWCIAHGKVQEGMREVYLFMAYNTAIQVFDNWKQAEKYVLDLNNRLDHPHTEAKLQASIFDYFEHRFAEYKQELIDCPYYCYKSATFLDTLKISSADYNAFCREGTREGIRAEKRTAKQERNEKIISMKLAGKTNAEIMAACGVSERTIRLVYAKYRQEQETEVERKTG